jgi:hypothetical protein
MSAWELFIVVFRCYRVRPIVVEQFFERLWRRERADFAQQTRDTSPAATHATLVRRATGVVAFKAAPT